MLYYFAIAICLAVLLQFGMWISNSIRHASFNRSQFEATRRLIQRQIKEADQQSAETESSPATTWNGFRQFYIDRLERPVASVTSIYLKPVDEKPIPSFKPGQHLPLRFRVPGESKPLVRCYSLSSGPTDEYYRVSVKQVGPPAKQPDLPAGKVSNFINRQLMVGDTVDAKAPNGSFHINDLGNAPVVLLAGGIGITPLYSMLEHLVEQQDNRLIILFYGVRNGREHTFKQDIHKLAASRQNVHIVTCYSNPDATDQLNKDYQVNGYVSIDLLKVLLPSNQCQFFMCGPPHFMQSVQQGLDEWQVPENRIHSEAFGPASISKKTKPETGQPENLMHSHVVKFSDSGKSFGWRSEHDSILELAEANDLMLDSGCRAGSCGTCATKLIRGKFEYPDGVEASCESDECLICIAKPTGNVELEA